MKKKLVLGILGVLVFLLASVASAATDWKSSVDAFFQKLAVQPQVVAQWKTGIKNEFNLDLVRLTMKTNLLDVDTTSEDGLVLLTVRFEFKLYCTDESGAKKQLTGSRDFLILTEDPPDFEIAMAKIIAMEPFVVTDGWDI